MWNTAYENVLYMACSDFFLSFGAILAFSRLFLLHSPLEEGDPFCSVSFFLHNCFGCSTIIWYFIIAINIFLMLHGIDTNKLIWLKVLHHIIAWGYGLATTLILYFKNLYSPIIGGYYCAILDPRDSHHWTTYGLLLLVESYCVFLLIYTGLASKLHWHRLPLGTSTIFRRLFFMIIVFVFVWGFSVTQRIIDYIYNERKGNLQMITICGSGLANFIVWGLGNPKLCNWGGCLPFHARWSNSDVGSSLLDGETDVKLKQNSLIYQAMQSVVDGNDGEIPCGIPLSSSFEIPRPASVISEEKYVRRHSN